MIGLVIPKSPGPTPAARQARCNAAVPLLTATAWRAPHDSAKASSKAPTAGPWVNQSPFSTRSTASQSSSSTHCRPYGSARG